MKQILKFIDWLAERSAVLSGYVTATIMLIVCYDVTMRYFFNRPTIFAQDVAEYLIVYATFMAAPWLLKKKSHVRVSIVIDYLSGRSKTLVGMFTSVLGIAVCLILFCWSSLEVWELFRDNVWIQRPLSVPKFTTRLPIPFGSFLLAIYFIRETISYIVDLRERQ